MKITFTNFGPIKKCELTLGKLVIFTGLNNTGKSYITHGVFGLLEKWRNLIALPPFHEEARALLTTGEASMETAEFSGAAFQRQIHSIAESYKLELANTLACDFSRFEETNVGLFVPESVVLESEIMEQRKFGTAQVSMSKAAKDNILVFTLIAGATDSAGAVNSRVPVLARMLREMVLDNIFAHYFPRVFISSSERTGAALFQGDLNPKRTDARPEEGFDDRLSPLSEEDLAPAYALAVQRSIEFLSSSNLQRIQRLTSPLISNRPDIGNALDAIAKGSFKATPEGTYFVPAAEGSPHLRLGESSSSVRSLLDVSYYIRHILRPGDCFMIDEPELNLHPRNQRLFARLIGRLVNAGIKVFITTHSDYIIRELNTLIVLAGRVNSRAKLLEELKYEANELIDAAEVRFYRTANESNQEVEETAVDATKGIEVRSFDEVIDELNEVQDAIIYTPEIEEPKEGEEE